MTPKTVLACLTDEADAATVSQTAAALADTWDAHLTGIFAMDNVVSTGGYPLDLPQSVYVNIAKEQKAYGDRLKAVFERETKDLRERSEWRSLSAEGHLPADRAIECARSADLVLMGAAENGATAHTQRLFEEAMIRGAGRPVIVIPEASKMRGIGRALMGWRNTAEATRALHDLVPMLAPGATLRLVAFGQGPRLGDVGDVMTDLAAALARHGLDVEIERRTDDVRSISDALQAEAEEFGADLLAVGAYGHSRAYDLVLGAVSRDLLRQTRMPVLFSR